MMTFLIALDALIPKIPFPFVAKFRIWAAGPGISLGRIGGGSVN